ncbi:hypothetical protein CK203_062579 [Vitis vinifera]|uniref:G-patch domain-containing protein n=1 Tax=Vitis vinifera TaxID=29760 RepID=A0A438FQD7_VITVI|nr:hypothetical protein CK203_062579 [Vitis vinifera]
MFIPSISLLHVQAIECRQSCWITTLPWMFAIWLPLLLAFLHLILDFLHRLLELMMGLRGLLWVKFIYEGRVISIQSDRDVLTSSKHVLQISHSDDVFHLTGFTFDKVQVVILEDDSKDMVPMSFDQYSNTLVLSMMKGMSYLPGLGLGRR